MPETAAFNKRHRLQYTDIQDDDDHSTKHEPDFSPFGVVESSFLGGGHPQLYNFQTARTTASRGSGVK
jgi:hypothetical protein